MKEKVKPLLDTLVGEFVVVNTPVMDNPVRFDKIAGLLAPSKNECYAVVTDNEDWHLFSASDVASVLVSVYTNMAAIVLH